MKATAEDLQRLGFGAVLHGERGELLMVIAPYMDEWHLIGCTVLRPDYSAHLLMSGWRAAYRPRMLTYIETRWDYELVAE